MLTVALAAALGCSSDDHSDDRVERFCRQMEDLDAKFGDATISPSLGPRVRNALDAIERPREIAADFATIIAGLDEVLDTRVAPSRVEEAENSHARTAIEHYVADRCDLRLENF